MKITTDMVIRELKKIEVTKAPGPDNTNNNILKYGCFINAFFLLQATYFIFYSDLK
jgi:hypothetical protein